MISDKPTIQRPTDAGSLHAFAQPGASVPAPKEISNVSKFRPGLHQRAPRAS